MKKKKRKYEKEFKGKYETENGDVADQEGDANGHGDDGHHHGGGPASPAYGRQLLGNILSLPIQQNT